MIPDVPPRQAALPGDPRSPQQFLEFQHMSGEVWITPDGRYVLCDGQENEKCARSAGLKSISPHNGPYAGVAMADCLPLPTPSALPSPPDPKGAKAAKVV